MQQILKQVTVTDKVPEGAELVSVQDSYGFTYRFNAEAGTLTGVNNSGKVAYTDGSIVWTVKRQSKLDNGAVYVTMRVAEDAKGGITNTAGIKYLYGDPDNSDNDKTVEDPGNPSITIPIGTYKRVTSAAGFNGRPISAGEELTYEVGWLDMVTDEPLTKVVMTDKLPPGLQFMGATDSAGNYKPAGSLDGEIAFDGETVTWTVEGASLARMGKVSVQVKVLGTVGSSVTNRADVTYFHGGSDEGTVEATPEVINRVGSHKIVDSTSEAGVDGAPVKPGQEIIYDISWLNPRSGHPLTGVVITDEAANGLELTGAYGTDGKLYAFDGTGFAEGAADAGLTYAGGAAVWTLKAESWRTPLADYGSVKVVMKVADSATGSVTNRAAIKYTNYDMDHFDETETDDSKPPEITNPIGAFKRVAYGSTGYEDTPVKAGDTITYELGWASYDERELKHVKLIDRPSKGLQVVGAYDSGGTYHAYTAGSGFGTSEELSYNKGAVIWLIEKAEGGEPIASSGKVRVVVRVAEKASGSVVNSANVEYGYDDGSGGTEIVEDPNEPKVTNPIGAYKMVPAGSAGYESKPIKAGDEVTYIIGWMNPSSEKKIAAVNISDAVPDGMELVGVYNNKNQRYLVPATAASPIPPSITVSEQQVSWSITDANIEDTGYVKVVMRVKEDVQGSITNRANISYTLRDDDGGEETVPEENPPSITLPIGSYKYVATDSEAGADGTALHAGETVTYRIDLLSPYKKDLATAVVTETVPAGMTVKEYETEGATLIREGTDGPITGIVWTIEHIPAGGTHRLFVEMEVSQDAIDEAVANGEGKLRNNAKISWKSENTGSDKEEDPAGDETPFTENPVGTAKYIDANSPGAGKKALAVGDEIEYVVQYLNKASDEQSVKITDTIPKGMEVLSILNGGTRDGDTITWNVSGISPDEAGTVSVRMRVTQSAIEAAAGGEIKNSASVEWSGNPGEPEEVTTTNPVTSKFVSADSEKGQDGAVLKDEDEITYTIRAVSPFKADTATAKIIDKLPGGIDLDEVTFEPDSGVLDRTERTITWDITGIEPGGYKEVTVKIKITPEAITWARNSSKGMIRNDATVGWTSENEDPNTKEPDPEEPQKPGAENPVTTAKFVTAGSPGADNAPVAVGDVIDYTIRYLSQHEAKTNVRITDYIPEGMEFVSASDDGAQKTKDGRATVEWTILGVEPGTYGERTVKLRVTGAAITAAKNGKIHNEADVQWYEDDGTGTVENPGTEIDEPEKPITENPVTSKFVHEESAAGVNGPAVKLGEKLTYVIQYVSPYKVDEGTATITDKIPVGMKVADEDIKDGGKRSGNTVTWEISGVKPGEMGSVSIAMEVTQDAIDLNIGGKIVNDAEVKWTSNGLTERTPPETEKPRTENPIGASVKYVGTGAGANGAAVKAGDDLAYVIELVSPFEKDTSTAKVKEYIPAEMTVVTPDGQQLLEDEGGKYLYFEETEIEAGTSRTINVVLRVTTASVNAARTETEGKLLNNLVINWETENTNDDKEDNPENPETPFSENPVASAKFVERGSAGEKGKAVKAGDTIRYVLQYVNPYKTNAAKVEITEKLSDGMVIMNEAEIIQSGGRYNRANQTIKWTIAKVEPGAYGTVATELQVTAQAITAVTDGKIKNNVDYLWTELDSDDDPTGETTPEDGTAENPVTSKFIAEDSPGAGGKGLMKDDIVEYVIQMISPYERDTATATILDEIPAGMEVEDAGGGVETEAGSRIYKWEVTVEAGEAKDVRIKLRVTDDAIAAAVNGKIRNEAEITWNTQNEGDDKEPDPETPDKPAIESPVGTVKFVDENSAGTGGKTLRAGDRVTYIIQYMNPYDEQTAQAVITESVPKGMRPVTWTEGGTYNPVAHTIVWDIGTLQNRQAGTVKAELEVTQAAIESAENGKIANTAKVKYTPQTGEEQEPEVKIENPVTSKSVAEGSPGQNGTLIKKAQTAEYRIYYASPFEKDLGTAKIIDYIPDGMSFAEASDGGAQAAGTNTVLWTVEHIEPLKPGEDTPYVTVKLTLDDPSAVKNGMVRNRAEVTWTSEGAPGEKEPDPEEPDKPAVENPVGTAKYVDNASAGAGGGTLRKGDVVTYVIQAVNPDEENEQTATIVETIPAGMEYAEGFDLAASGGTESTVDGKKVITWTKAVPAGGMEQIQVSFEVTEAAITAAKEANAKIRNEVKITWTGGFDDEDVSVDNPTESFKYVDEGTGASGAPVRQGDKIEYTIQYVNPYRNNRATLRIVDTIPKGAKIIESAGGELNEIDGTLTWERTVAAGGSGSIGVVIEVTKQAIDASREGRIINAAKLNWEPIGPVIDDDDDDDDDSSTDKPKDEEDITAENPLVGAKFVDKSGEARGADGTAVYVGDVISYTVIAHNPYKTDASVTLTDKIPVGMEFVGVQNGEYKADEGIVVGTFTEIPPGMSESMVVRLRVTEEAITEAIKSSNGKIRNEAKVEWSTEGEEEDITETPATENPAADAKFVEDGTIGAKGKPVKIGDAVEYVIQYVNPEKEKAATLTITDTLPPGATVDKMSEGGVHDRFAGTITWTIPVPAGDSGTVGVVLTITDAAAQQAVDGKIKNTVSMSWDYGDGNPPIVKNPDPAENPVTSKSVSGITEAGGTDKTGKAVAAGDLVTYKIHLASPFEHNTGTAKVTDYLPTGMNYVSSSVEPTVDNTARTLTWTGIKVSAGMAGEITVVLQVTPAAIAAAEEGKIRNTAQVEWDSDGDGETEETPLGPQNPGVDVPIATSKYANIGSTGYQRGTLAEGDEVQYVIQAVSPFSRDKGTAEITERIPAGMQLVSGSYGDGTLSANGETITWTVRDIEPGAVAYAKVSMTVTAAAIEAAEGGLIKNTASVRWTSQDNTETPPANPQVPETTNPVTPVTATKLIESGNGVNGARVEQNSNVTYTIHYRNHSSKPVSISIADKLSDGLRYISHTTSGHVVQSDEANGTVTWKLEVPAHERGFVTVTAMVTAARGQTISNSANISWRQERDGEDPWTGVITTPPTTNEVTDTGGSDNGGGRDGGGGGGQTAEIPVVFHWNDSREDDVYYSTTVRSGQTVSEPEPPKREGYFFLGWYTSAAGRTPFDFRTVITSETHLYAKWQENILNMDDHFAYIIGYPDGYVRPNSNITRAEAATIFFRLLQPEVRGRNFSTQNSFTDVNASMWYNKALSTLVSTDIIDGYPDGTFRGDDTITRAEFATIAANFLGENAAYTGETAFADIRGHWAERSINLAVKQGWIEGYTDASFRPEANISRAEVMTLVNRMLNRMPQSPNDLHQDMEHWPDNADTSAWFYLAVQEATNTHDYEMDGAREIWTGMRDNYDWAGLENPGTN